MAERTWAHDDLAHDLAETRRQCGEIVATGIQAAAPDATGLMDVYSLRPSWSNPMPTCWEVKVDRRDFERDVRECKYEGYLPACRRLYFAVPSGLIGKDDVPKGMGLTVRNEKGWHVLKAPRSRPMTDEALSGMRMALLLRLHGDRTTMANPDIRAVRHERMRRIAAEREIRTWSVRISAEIRRQIDDGLFAAARVDSLRQKVAEAIGEEPGDRPLDELVRLAMARGPRADVAAKVIDETSAIRDELGTLMSRFRVLNHQLGVLANGGGIH